MHIRRVTVLAALAASLAVGATSHAQPQPRAASSSQAPAPTGPLASGLEAARTSDYPRAERELAAIRGADQAAAQVALARVYYEQGKFAEAERTGRAQVGGAQAGFAAAVVAQVLFAQGKVQDAIKLLEPLKGTTGPAGRRVKLLLGEYRLAIGKRSDAEEPLMKIIEEYNDQTIASNDAEGLATVGRTAHLLRSAKDANTAFNESERADKKRFETLMWRGELFLEKYDPGHAEEVVKEALVIAPKSAAAMILMARVKLDQALDFDAAEKLVNDALAINPKLTSAFAVRAGLALRDMDLAIADKAIAAGLAINPNDLELLSLKATSRFLADDRAGYEQGKKEVLSRNAEYARFFQIAAEYAEWEHRYDDIVAMMKEATKIDADDGRAWGELGLTQMRAGDETAGFESIKKAFGKDGFNVRVFNTLNLYEKTIPNDYETATEGPFKIRYAKDEKKVLERYVPKLLAEAFGSMKGRYNFVPQTPVQVELYETREQFSVRTSGLPNIGIQGVCFGRVLAAMSPKSESFNWGNVVWHELGHVFAIQLSKNHVPRWFTEGLSEYETIARRPEWQRELDPELYTALIKNALPSAVDMNRAFTHASDGLDVTVAYYAASQMLVFTVETFGTAKVTQALKLWGEGLRTPDVLQKAFGVPASEYDAKFRAWALKRLSRYQGQFVWKERSKSLEEAQKALLAAPNDPNAHLGVALAYLHARKIADATKEIDAALKIDPNHMPSHYIAAKIGEAQKDVPAQELHLKAIQKAGGDGYQVQMALADVAEAKKDKPGMKAALTAAAKFDPVQSEPLKGLFDLAKEENRDADQIDILKKLAPLEQHDRKIWRLLLGKLVAAKRWDEAKKVGESTLFVDVETASVHAEYARALGATGAHDAAMFELESAILCGPPPKEAAAIHAQWAAEAVAVKNGALAKKHKDEALRLDPTNAEAKAIP